MRIVKCRTMVVLICFAVSGFFVANVLATARPEGLTVTIPTAVPTVPTVVPTVSAPVSTTAPITQSTVVPTTVPVSVPDVPTTVPAATVAATTPVATVSVTTPSVNPVVTTSAGVGSATVPAGPDEPGTRPAGAGKTRGERGATPVASQGSPANPGSSPGTASSGSSTGNGSVDSGQGASPMPVVASRAGRPVVLASALRVARLPGAHSAVGLRFVLSRAARVRFLVIGPAPSCQVAGRFVLSGHRGLNKVVFRGRLRGRLLAPGTYTIVPQPAAGPVRRAPAAAVAIDARGVRPTAPVRWRNCDPAAAAPTAVAGSGNTPLAHALHTSGVAAASASAPTQRKQPLEDSPAFAMGWLPGFPKSPQFSGLLLALLAVSIALLSIAAIEPGDTLRFRTVRAVARHQAHIAVLGGTLLVSAILLFFLL